MARPGRPAAMPQSIQDLNTVLSNNGNLVEEPPQQIQPKPKKAEPETYIFEMVGNFARDPENGTIRYPGLSLPNSQLVYDEDTGTTRMARLIRGYGSIWVDEQKDLDQNFVDRNKPNLSFNEGKMIISSKDKNTVKYLLLCSDFEGCKRPAVNRKPRYRLVDTEGQQEKRLNLLKKIKDAEDKALSTPMEELLPHAKYLGIGMVDENGLPKTEAGIRADYIDKAKGAGFKKDSEVEAQVDLFLRTYNNPKVKMYGLVKKAFESDMIVFVDGQAIWNDTKVLIAQIPGSKNAPEYLAEMMLTKEGAELKSRLESL